MVTINKYDELKSALASHDECLVKIGTSSCGPCKMVQKNMEDIEKFHSDVYFIDVDAEESDDRIIEEFSVRNVPVTLVIKNGEVVSRQVGLQTQAQLEERL